MSSSQNFNVVFHKDGSATALGRVTGSTTTNSIATGIAEEGYWLQQADVTSITRNIYNTSSSTPDTALSTTVLTVSSVVKDTPETSSVLWNTNGVGYNFEDLIAASNFDTSDVVYRVDYVWVTTGGEGFTTSYEGRAEP